MRLFFSLNLMYFVQQILADINLFHDNECRSELAYLLTSTKQLVIKVWILEDTHTHTHAHAHAHTYTHKTQIKLLFYLQPRVL